jgi:8-oxo-dGTP pyrophosphatase MutT (NUDIX family)
VARLRTATATSAGGIVVRDIGGALEFVVGCRRRERAVTWTLPKGTPEPGESIEETALREVAEETGLAVRIVRPIGDVRYTFVRDGTRFRKRVHYYLMEATGGDLADHDHEFESVQWLPFRGGPSTLTFETERNLVVRTARELGVSNPDEAG